MRLHATGRAFYRSVVTGRNAGFPCTGDSAVQSCGLRMHQHDSELDYESGSLRPAR
jgi:hypothetical protein